MIQTKIIQTQMDVLTVYEDGSLLTLSVGQSQNYLAHLVKKLFNGSFLYQVWILLSAPLA
ncbi:hypothetical protein A2697_04035 [Candidatus Curtissbacteria bacterium RIFCSPHIGHO2_01_FULL_41_44]|uniref:Uncharacterized protein n=1 Tax=Candidatus Curtissbacteria bacterium RIFCSPLOWO2_01_FULL_42_50 TaxID=1797730 RepID=A0A1F5H2Y7_9BACT|nr:MAG: hypothetical protein A2697_04035 [Candidatus Curtissbacteria bacterium RIFCSPHIGHO2_01_FULL_41_44]OGD92901.1 MAG: hypothetical protein A3C33_02225 [Candidatus Curtissbacteria bacterium RIFCSPHIGHO2_02_FULL_42_58]OGD96634.1 MAG: hypothetical protein A3E71_00720 [Candidatus Curtissbacteria bacterium RIFCSPHIGHO2_12_FULL_42_33]OGD98522.1 MAG: hypothetical protein A3B54_00270 [Candidatus Curtissbacteria bacterium RIFCSPLOWO2_01_FULL_42_50]OGE02882.1 MAG: hypothetical protein A3G16_04310 [Ca